MQCRLLKKFSLTFGSIFVAVSGASALSASASTVIPQVPYVSTAVNNVQTIFIASKQSSLVPAAPITLVDTTVGFRLFDFSATATAASDPTGLNIVKFVVTSAETFLSITAAPAVPGANIQIPIAWSQGAPCTRADGTESNGTCSNELLTPGNASAILTTPNTPYEIGINLNDVCANYAGIAGCDDVSVPKQVATTINGTTLLTIPPFALTFEFGTAISSSTGGDTAQQNVQVEVTPPTFTCPTNNDLIYFPGDGQISLDPSQFVPPAPPLTNSVPNTLIFIAADSTAPDETINFSANSVVARIALGGGPFNVGGITDTTTGTDHVYQVGFSVGDLAGVLSPFTNCGVKGIQTSPIQTFLKKSGCFIATAAFRSGEDEPVRMLRRFRDEVLLEYDVGQIFVKWYYSWSPGAAEWLMENPVFRFPVLFALIPVQIIGWLALHSSFLIVLLLTSIGLSSFLLVRVHRLTLRRNP